MTLKELIMKKLRNFLPALVMVIASLAATIAILPSNASAQEAHVRTERNRRVIQQAFEQWSKGGHTFFQVVLAPDAVWAIKRTSPAAGTYRNRQDSRGRDEKPFADRMSTPVRPPQGRFGPTATTSSFTGTALDERLRVCRTATATSGSSGWPANAPPR
jgi:type II secretory pathway pseudopilin PulG